MRGFVKFIAALSITMLLMLMFRALFFTVYKVSNSSLEPQFIRGDRILVNKCSYGLRTGEDTNFGYSRWLKQDINKGDITAFNYPIDTLQNISTNPVYVGVCSALPGDTVYVNSSFSLIVPGKDITVDVTEQNAILFCNILRMHEHRDCYICDGFLYVDGKQTDRIRFSKDYYWMSSFSFNAADDSRFFGFVPEDHLVGRVVMTVYSKDDDKPFLRNFRWDRFLKLL